MGDNISEEPEVIFVNDIYGTYQYVHEPKDWIGSGAWGTVFRATVTEPKGLSHDTTFAVKVVRKTPEEIQNRVLLRKRWTKMLELNHRNLIRYYKVTIHKAEGGATVEFLMDYVNRGEHLTRYMAKLKEDKRMLDRTDVICYALQIADGLAYLHENKFINGDLKPENVLVKHTSNTHKTMLITDLDDIVHKIGQLTTVRDIPRLVGTYRYMSPEMIKKFIGDTTVEKIGSKTDIWSLGCIILKMANCAFGLDGEWLHKDQSTKQIKSEKEDFSYYEYAKLLIDGWLPLVSSYSIPFFIASRISRCFTVDSVDRISAQALVRELKEAVNLMKRDAAQFPDGCYCVNQLVPPARQLSEYGDRSIPDSDPGETFGSRCEYYYDSTNYISRGVFGTVYEARVTKHGDYSGKLVVVVKTVQFRQEEVDLKARWWKKLQENWKNLLRFKHEHLVRLHKVTVIRALAGSHVEFMMDFCTGRDLTSFLQKWNTDGSVPNHLTAICYGTQIADGLRFLHENDIIHGNLASENVLVKYAKYRHHTLVIGDLGMNLRLRRNDVSAYDVRELRLTVHYMSPEMTEVVAGMPNHSIGRQTDIWSLGCVILDLANHVANNSERWFYNSDTGERVNLRSLPAHMVMLKVLDGFTPYVADCVYPSLARSIKQCLYRDPAERISAAEIVNQLSETVKEIVTSTPESMGSCRGCMCCDLFPDSKDFTNTFCMFHYFSCVGSSSNVRMQIFIPFNNELHSIPLPPSLNGKTFLLNPVTVGSEVICHVKDGSSSNKAIETQAWDVADNSCRTLYSPPHLNMSAMVIMDNTVYFWNKRALSSPLKSMDLSDGNVTSLPVPAKISEVKLHRHQSKIFCCANNECDAWVQCFDTVTKVWETLPDMPEARSGYAMTDLDSSIYILGGSVSDGNDLVNASTCIRFSMETRTWEPISSLLHSRSHHGAFVSSNRIHVFGGVVSDSSELSHTMEWYDELSNSWSQVELSNADEDITDQKFTMTTICGPYKWPKSVKFPIKV